MTAIDILISATIIAAVLGLGWLLTRFVFPDSRA